MKSISFLCALITPALLAATELEVRNVSGPEELGEVIAVTVDPRGVIYATQTARRKQAELDIRQFKDWTVDDIRLTTVEQKRDFLIRSLPTGSTAKRGDMKDWNKDGSIDHLDLTMPRERVWRLEDTNGDGVAERRTLVAEGFNEVESGIAAGLLWHEGSLFMAATPSLHRLDDADGDGSFERQRPLVTGFGVHLAYAGHDMHGVRLGPDGRLYWTIGDKGLNVTAPDGRRWEFPRTGALMRCDPDGSHFEVVAHGLRNVQEIAFDENGDIFGVDNDADHPGEKERLLFILPGADHGWRCNYQYRLGDHFAWMDEKRSGPRNPLQPAHLVPAIQSYLDGPSGFAFNPGTALGDGFERTFLLGQFPAGRVNAFRLEPDGAGFRLTNDRVVSAGHQAVGFAWGPDGALYAADWEGGYELNGKGAVRALDVPAAKRDSRRAETAALLRDGLRGKPAAEVVKRLGHPDQRVRVLAQTTLARAGETKRLVAVARDLGAGTLARLHAVWGVAQAARLAGHDGALPELAGLADDVDAQVRALAATVLSESLRERVPPSLHAAWTRDLAHPVARMRLHAALALSRAPSPTAVTALVALARENADADVWLRNAVIQALAACAKPAELSALRAAPEPAVRRAAVVALRFQRSPAAADFLADKDPTIANEAALAIHDADIPAALPALAARLPELPAAAPDSLVRRAISANHRVGDAESLARVARFTLATTNAKLRDSGLRALAAWITPPPLNLVDDAPLDLPARDAAALRVALTPHWPALSALPSQRVPPVAKAFGFTHDAGALAKRLDAASAPLADRLAALEQLAEEHPRPKDLETRLNKLAADAATPAELRLRAAELLPAGTTASEALAALANGSDRAVAQLALPALVTQRHARAEAAVDALLVQLKAGTLPVELRLDLVEAIGARKDKSDWKKAAAAHTARAGAFADSLAGGDPAAGREIVFNHLEAGCIRCHSAGDEVAATIGPNLKGVGARLPPEKLLQSLLEPAAVVAPGYGLAVISLKSGESVAGYWLGDDASGVRLRLPEGGERVVPDSSIAAKGAPITSMPPMGGLLTPRQVRDVVAYLGTLR